MGLFVLVHVEFVVQVYEIVVVIVVVVIVVIIVVVVVIIVVVVITGGAFALPVRSSTSSG